MKYLLSTPYNCAQAAKTELKRLGYPLSRVITPTTLEFEWDEIAIARVNIWSRVANKLYLTVWECNALTREHLYEWVLWARREHWLSPGQWVIVTANSKHSQLTSTPTIQSISQKAIYDKVSSGEERVTSDEITPLEIMISIDRNQVTILLNSSGYSLHRRGYRLETGAAPIKENLAAAIILDSGWKFDTPLYDICCGSGTIAIEAAMIAKNIAPGLHRDFAFQSWGRYDQNLYAQEMKSAYDAQRWDKQHTIIASDIDPDMIQIGQWNAERAWLTDVITWMTKDVHEYVDQDLTGTLVSNPPYGDRLKPHGIAQLYTALTKIYQNNPELNWGLITSYDWSPHSKWSQTLYYNWSEEVTWWKKKMIEVD
jgi:putative N6-adenine-specific DNA methylase